ncbi:MAG: hypothetical protein ACKVWR_03480 [Acidimicrobiales bacterium]
MTGEPRFGPDGRIILDDLDPDEEPRHPAGLDAVLAAALAEPEFTVSDQVWDAALDAVIAERFPARPEATVVPLFDGGSAGGDAVDAGRRVVVSRTLAAAAAEGAREPSGQLSSGDGRFVTEYEENEAGRLVVTVTGPPGFEGLVSLGWTVDHGAGPAGRELLVTPLAAGVSWSRSVYDLGSVADASSYTLEVAGPAAPEEINEDSIRAALGRAVPYGNAIRAWRAYRERADTPAWAAGLVDELLAGLAGR